MLPKYIITLSSLLAIAVAGDFPPYVPPGPGDVRSPCPALNSLANHGLIPHNGKGLTIPILIDGLEKGLNVGADVAITIGGAGILSVRGHPTATSFDLNDLNAHNFPIEHDASLSRGDFHVQNGDNFSFNQTIFDQVLKFYDGMTTTTIPVASKAKYSRVLTEKARDSKFTYTAQQFILSYGETALYLSVMGNPITGIAPLDYVKVFFQEERLPYSEGWRRPSAQTNLETLGRMMIELQAANGELIPEGLEITTNTLKLAFGGYNPITGIIAHLIG